MTDSQTKELEAQQIVAVPSYPPPAYYAPVRYPSINEQGANRDASQDESRTRVTSADQNYRPVQLPESGPLSLGSRTSAFRRYEPPMAMRTPEEIKRAEAMMMTPGNNPSQGPALSLYPPAYVAPEPPMSIVGAYMLDDSDSDDDGAGVAIATVTATAAVARKIDIGEQTRLAQIEIFATSSDNTGSAPSGSEAQEHEPVSIYAGRTNDVAEDDDSPTSFLKRAATLRKSIFALLTPPDTLNPIEARAQRRNKLRLEVAFGDSGTTPEDLLDTVIEVGTPIDKWEDYGFPINGLTTLALLAARRERRPLQLTELARCGLTLEAFGLPSEDKNKKPCLARQRVEWTGVYTTLLDCLVALGFTGYEIGMQTCWGDLTLLLINRVNLRQLHKKAALRIDDLIQCKIPAGILGQFASLAGMDSPIPYMVHKMGMLPWQYFSFDYEPWHWSEYMNENKEVKRLCAKFYEDQSFTREQTHVPRARAGMTHSLSAPMASANLVHQDQMPTKSPQVSTGAPLGYTAAHPKRTAEEWDRLRANGMLGRQPRVLSVPSQDW